MQASQPLFSYRRSGRSPLSATRHDVIARLTMVPRLAHVPHHDRPVPRPLSMFQNNPGSRPEREQLPRSCGYDAQSGSPPRRSRGFRTPCGRHRLRKKQNRSMLETELCLRRALPARKCITDRYRCTYTPPQSPQQRVRVRVTADRLVARTRSESSSSALKVAKSCLLHCYCGGRLHLGKPPPCSRPDQDKRGSLGSHSATGARMIELTLLSLNGCDKLLPRAAARLCHHRLSYCFRPSARPASLGS